MPNPSESISEENKRSDIRIYVVAVLLFSCILAGGAFLAMYITLPESESSSWYPVAGIVLVCVPWLFWVFMYVYSIVKATSLQRQRHVLTAPTSPISNQHTGSEPTENASYPASPVGKPRKSGEESSGPRVHFGGAAVISNHGSYADDESDESRGTSSLGVSPRDEDGAESSQQHSESRSPARSPRSPPVGKSPRAKSLSGSNNGSFSVGSHESEVPLALSMSP